MKRVYLSLLLTCLSIVNVKSQLQVDSIGYVGVGVTDEILEYDEEDSIQSPLSVCTAGIVDAIASFQSTDRQYSLTSYTIRQGYANGTGLWSVSDTHYGNSEGIIGVGMSNNSNVSNTVIGVRGEVFGGHNSVGVYGGSYGYVSNNYAGIYGSGATNSSNPYFQYPGNYAGYFNGTVRATGPMYAQAFYTPSAKSTGTSNNGKSSVSLIGEEERVSDKLRTVSSFEILHNEQRALEERPSPVEEFLKGRSHSDLTKKERLQLDSICSNIAPVEKDPLSDVNYGLDAEQLKAMFPKLVHQDKEGNYSINYVEMIPLLVRGINELSEEIAILKGEGTESARKAKSVATGIDETKDGVDMVRMDQNKPNPFSGSTVIGLNIPEKTQKASIFIYDLSGKQIQNVPVAERGETNITVYASDLSAGMYIYTLVVDGKVAVTRRMIVSGT